MHMPLLKELQLESKRLKADINTLPSIPETGENITLEGTSDARFKKLEVSGNSIQDGEPTPETPIEIRSCGDNVNLFDIDSVEWGKYELSDGGKGNYQNAFIGYINNVNAGENYSISFSGAKHRMSYFFKDKEGNTLSGKYYSSPIDERKIEGIIAPEQSTQLVISQLDAKNGELKVKVEKGKKSTTWSPYNYGNINFKITNSLLDTSWAQDLLNRLNVQSTDENNCITEIDGHRYLKYSCALGYTQNTDEYISKVYFAKDCFKPNIQYTFKAIAMKDNDAISANMAFYYTDGTQLSSQFSQNANMKRTEHKITSEPNKTVKCFGITYNSRKHLY